MKILTASQVKDIDRLTIENEHISSLDLMERASKCFTQWFTNHFDPPGPVIVFAGSGNNGGDALAVARMLIERQYSVKVYLVGSGSPLSVDCAANVEKLKPYTVPVVPDTTNNQWFPLLSPGDIVIDGIFGSGLNRPVEGLTAELLQHINKNSGCTVSIDIPSGLFGEDNRFNTPGNIIKADYTVRFELPLLSFYIEGNEKYTGEWEIIPIGLHKQSIEAIKTGYSTIETEDIQKLIIPRKKFSHKGTYGHALIIAGRYGMMGAAVLSAKACLRGGAGLVTSFIPKKACDILQSSVPEALIRMGKSDEIFDELPVLTGFQAIACGPAIGTSEATTTALYELLINAGVPLVLDADALNILSEHKDWLERLPSGTILTPHPKEFDRLAGESPDMYSRHLKQVEFSKKYNIFVVLKGPYTIITDPAGTSYINTTGNPGMATGGTGDVLTGLVVSLLAQGYSPLNSALIAVHIHGLAGDIALQSSSMEALVAGDVVEHLGKAFRYVKDKK